MKKNYYLKSFLVAGSLLLSTGLWASKVTVGNFTSGSLKASVETAQGGTFASDTLEITGSVQFAADDYTYLKGLVAVMDMSNYEFTDATVPSQAFLEAKMTGLLLPKNLKGVSRQSFKGCAGLKSLIVPASLDTIGDYGFDSCSQLLSVVFLSNNTILKSQVFRSCYKLMSANIPSRNKRLEGTFYSCRALPSVYIPATVDSIGASTFTECDNMTSLYLAATTPPKLANAYLFPRSKPQIIVPKGSLDAYKAANVWKDFASEIREADVVYVNLTESGKLKDSVEAKNGGAFNKDVLLIGGNVPFATDDYTYLKSITSSLDISSYLFVGNTLPEDAFSGATFNAIALPASLKTVERYALQNCKMIASVYIPASVDSIAASVFSGCSKLNKVNFASRGGKIRSIMDAAFENCTSLDTITLPNTITTLGGNVFAGCTKLKSANIPAGIDILTGTFQSCSALTSITIPESVTKIDFQTFFNCTSLQTIYSENTTPPTLPTKAVFAGVPRTAIVYVKDAAAKAAYEAAPKWADLVQEGIQIKVKTLGINDVKTSEITVNVYPNPVIDVLNISDVGNSTINEVVVTDLSGRLVAVYHPSASDFSLSAANWNSGIYVIKVITSKGTGVYKVVKK